MVDNSFDPVDPGANQAANDVIGPGLSEDEYRRRTRVMVRPDLTPNQRVQAGFDLVAPPPIDPLPQEYSSPKPFLGNVEGEAFSMHPDIEDRRNRTMDQVRMGLALDKQVPDPQVWRRSEDPLLAQVPQPDPHKRPIPNAYKTQLPETQTQLSPKEEADYIRWAHQNGIKSTVAEEMNYDLRGFYKSGGQFGANRHAPDTFKKPNHPTFSDESQYNGLGGDYGGHWAENPDKTWTFHAGQANIDNWGPDALREYFKRYEPGNKILFPEDPGYGEYPGNRDMEAQPPLQAGPDWGEPDLPIRKKR